MGIRADRPRDGCLDGCPLRAGAGKTKQEKKKKKKRKGKRKRCVASHGLGGAPEGRGESHGDGLGFHLWRGSRGHGPVPGVWAQSSRKDLGEAKSGPRLLGSHRGPAEPCGSWAAAFPRHQLPPPTLLLRASGPGEGDGTPAPLGQLFTCCPVTDHQGPTVPPWVPGPAPDPFLPVCWPYYAPWGLGTQGARHTIPRPHPGCDTPLATRLREQGACRGH